MEVEGRAGDMPPLHVHHDHDETFIVLEGRVSLHLPERCVTLGPGESFFAARGIPHVYRVESQTEDDGFPPADREPDLDRIGAAAARQGIELLGPPGTMPG